MDVPDVQQLRAALHSPEGINPSVAVRRVMQDALRHPSQTVELIPDFYALCGSDLRPTASAAWAAIWRYGNLAVPFLLWLLNSESPSDRRNAIELLLSLGHRRSTWRIAEQILDDRPFSIPDWKDRHDEVIAQLQRATHDSDSAVHLLAATTLDDLGIQPDDLIPIMIAGLDSSEPALQNLAALHLGRLGRSAAIALPALHRFVNSNHEREIGVHRPALAAAQAIRRIVPLKT